MARNSDSPDGAREGKRFAVDLVEFRQRESVPEHGADEQRPDERRQRECRIFGPGAKCVVPSAMLAAISMIVTVSRCGVNGPTDAAASCASVSVRPTRQAAYRALSIARSADARPARR